MWLKLSVLAVVTFLGVATSTICAGYTAQNVTQSSTGLTANLKLVGSGCNIYGDDLDDLVLNVEYQTGKLNYLCDNRSPALMKCCFIQPIDCTCRYMMQLNKYIKFHP